MAPVVLTILDGWGHRDEEENNAIRQGDTPVMEALWHAYPHTLIQASGSHVGLPDQQMGNSSFCCPPDHTAEVVDVAVDAAIGTQSE